jgi:hypothetical protein
MNKDLVKLVVDIMCLGANSGLEWQQIEEPLARLAEKLRNRGEMDVEPPPVCPNFKLHESYHWLVENFGEMVTMPHLRVIADFAVGRTGVSPPKRPQKRKRERLLGWFAENWDAIRDILANSEVILTELPLPEGDNPQEVNSEL